MTNNSTLKVCLLFITVLIFCNNPAGWAQLSSSTAKIISTSSFWDIFSNDYRANCKKWNHNTAGNPVIPAGKELWNKYWTANPAVITYKGNTMVYFRGNGITASNKERHDRIAVARINEVRADKISYELLNDNNYIVDVGPKGTFDDSDVLDPGAVEFRGKLYLYYSGVGTGPNSVGLAISSDGIHFEKYGKVIQGRSPSVIVSGMRIYMIYQNDTGNGYRDFFLAVSDDGINFKNVSENAVLSGAERSWDKFVTTARLYKENDTFLLLYGGSPDLNDQPDYFGLARSNDFISWEKHPGNPIFGTSAKGEEDGGSIWFPALIETATHYILLYEGSRGRYAWDLSSQICMSSIVKVK